jgi:uncharacterized protein YhaN
LRILRLDLEKYGHFTGKPLDFRPDAHLHVVYGANEAGKTSALNALADLLFGFLARTTFNFLHPNPTLLLGATIKDRNGSVLSFKRRKGTSKTLLDSFGGVLQDSALTPFLGLVDRAVFLNAWGLSKETLAAGALQMLATGGEAGISLFAAASGLRGLIEAQKKLETDAASIFTPVKAQGRTFYQAKDRFDVAATQVRNLELAARDLRVRREAIAVLREDLEKARNNRRDVILRREILVRLKDIGPILNLIAADEELLRAWEHLPAMDGSRVRQLRLALNESEEQLHEFARLRREEATAKAAFESFVVESPLIALGPAIQELVGELGSYADKKRDLPRVQAEANTFKADLENYAMGLGLSADTDLALIRPNELMVTRLKGQIAGGKAIALSLKANEKAVGQEKEALSTLKKQESGSVPVSAPRSFQEQLARLLPTLNLLKEIDRLDRSTTRESAQIKEKAAQLFPPVMDLDALAFMSLPAKDIIDGYRVTKENLEGERGILQGSLDETTQNLPVLQAKVDELAGGQLASAPEMIAAVRADRNDHWQPLKSVLLQESANLSIAETATHVIGLEEGMGAADRLADDAVQNADRLASHGTALKALRDAQLKLEKLTDLLNERNHIIKVQEDHWQGLWQPIGFQATTPIRMSVWVGLVDALIERRTNNLDEQQQLTKLRNEIAAIRPALNQIARSLGIIECEELPVGVLHAAVDRELGMRAEAWSKASNLITRLADAEDRITALGTEKEKLLTTEAGWGAGWNEVLPAMYLPPDTSVEGVEMALEIWGKVPAALNQHKDRTARVHGMERDMLGFQARTAALLAQLNEPDLGLGPEAAIKAVAQRLNQSQQVETQAKMAEKRFKELGQQVLLAETTVEEAVEALEALCEGLPPSPNRIQQVLELEEREKILERLKERRQTLKPLSRRQTEAELRQGLEAFDETAAGAEIEALKIEEAQHNQRENEIYTSLTNAEADLTRLESGVGAEVAVQLRKNAEAELLQNTHDWAVKRFAQILLAHAIEQHRSQQEQPLLKKASRLFSLLTANSFAGVEQELDETDTFRLVGRRDAEHTLGYSAMSEGTQFQLYLALRLAYLDEYAQKAEPMPFIGDDLLASFDDQRTRRGVKALAEIGSRIQPILFTHHSRVVELAREELGDRVDVVNLD